MLRAQTLQNLIDNPHCDILIIGGGASGLGAAVDAASRGFRTVLVEQHDFAKATSSRSTKLIHGGLRYLQQGRLGLVMESLHERGLLCKNAPHLIHHLQFLVPNYRWWEGLFYKFGLKCYDILAGKLGIESSRHLSRREALLAVPTLKKKELRGGTIYYDGQFDDARLAIALARTAADHGGLLINYCKAISFIKKNGLIQGVKIVDEETGKSHKIYPSVVINATGVFADRMRQIDDAKATPIIIPSRGSHITLPRSFMPSDSAILIPHTDDGRVVFLVPWHDCIIVGTTDIPVHKISIEPHALKKEVLFLLKCASQYLEKKPTEADILSVFSGLRPLVKAGKKQDTAALSRNHSILVSRSKLITLVGGKWTTYRKMGQDVIDRAILVGNLPKRPSVTQNLRLHGFQKDIDSRKHFATYGSDAKVIRKLMQQNRRWRQKIHPKLPYYIAEVIWAARHEMARSVEDVLARRTRSLILNAQASIEAAPTIAKLLAKELGKNKTWEKQQCMLFRKLALQSLPEKKRRYI